MRLRTANCRRKRQTQAKPFTGKPFCYMVYFKIVLSPIVEGGLVVNYETRLKEWNRPFPNYGEAIAHLTRVKLAIDEEDWEWKFAAPCKIVEGVYTKSGKEKIIKTTRLNNECDRPPERYFSSGLPRQQRGVNFPVYQSVAANGTVYSGSGWTAASSSTATTVDLDRNATAILSNWDRCTTLSSN